MTVNKPIIKDKDKDEKIENKPNSSVGNDNKTNVPIINDSKDNKEEVPIVATDFKTLINNTKLNDVKEDPVLDALTKPVYDAVITPGMSNYDKLLAIYGYFTRNIKFGDIINYDNQSIINYTKNKRYSFQDSASILYGGQSLRNKKGTSRSNAMAFTLVAKRLGFDIKTAYENTSYGYTINYWSMIELNI